jgi:hypothetical protein
VDNQISQCYVNPEYRRFPLVRILNVDYIHLALSNGEDMYITSLGLPILEHLKPENFWTDKKWFQEHSRSLSGTSCLYKIRTKSINGRFKDIVLKWNRMGQVVPGEELDCQLIDAEFNSPFEEFSLVMELRHAMRAAGEKTFIQKPLAIYVPAEPVELWQTGREKYKMQAKIDAHSEISLDMYRLYAVLYEWIKGFDVVQAFQNKLVSQKTVHALTLHANDVMEKKGFVVRDNKPHHLIVRAKNNLITRNKSGNILYGLVDFELLQRIPEEERKFKQNKRTEYLRRQRDRFTIEFPPRFPPYLKPVNFFGVDYVYGNVESTKGRLWVVGKDPYLFDYFLPERWEKIPKTKISVYSEMYYTLTKDNIHHAWKVSHVGLRPDLDPFKEDENKILEYGYNSPFEEAALAVELSRKGLATIYPRAIYMTSLKTEIADNLFDNSRYQNHQNLFTPDELPILQKNYEYIMIWGYWNGPDEKLAAQDGDYYEGVNTLQAYRQGLISQKQYFDLLQLAKEKLLQAGIEDLNLRGNHLLISHDSKGNWIKDYRGELELRICNFEFLKKIP